ncbi:HEAT repeat domain-containing protein [Gordonia insulae]|uniref:HEAT repeat-containing protein n=1 Tax=Gordonia insulae TaxID=2420509 RepID=A0A3G8JJ44_9ACTN|nr:HEAT repeat domain-containing protein [Gordonia insulae]AZG44499.1 hypothetical protein D7316_01085 [Gordonia insulae]
MAGRHWKLTPRQSIEQECRRRGRLDFVLACSRMLDGDDTDPGLIIALGGPPGMNLVERGLPEDLTYWLRVWAGRGLFWVWDDVAQQSVLDAADDVHWRVREWVAKIAGKHELVDAMPELHRLADDPVARVRTAATRAIIELA